jgi:hypothetical protein
VSRSVDRPARPYLEAPAPDEIQRTITALLAELWVLRDRVAVLEHLLEGRKLLPERAVTDFVPDAELARRLEQERDALVARVVGAAHAERYDYQSLSAKPDRD